MPPPPKKKLTLRHQNKNASRCVLRTSLSHRYRNSLNQHEQLIIAEKNHGRSHIVDDSKPLEIVVKTVKPIEAVGLPFDLLSVVTRHKKRNRYEVRTVTSCMLRMVYDMYYISVEGNEWCRGVTLYLFGRAQIPNVGLSPPPPHHQWWDEPQCC